MIHAPKAWWWSSGTRRPVVASMYSLASPMVGGARPILCREKSSSAPTGSLRGRAGRPPAPEGTSTPVKTVSTIVAQSRSWSRISLPRNLEPKRSRAIIAFS